MYCLLYDTPLQLSYHNVVAAPRGYHIRPSKTIFWMHSYRCAAGVPIRTEYCKSKAGAVLTYSMYVCRGVPRRHRCTGGDKNE